MKAMFVVLFVLICGFLVAEMNPFEYVGSGYFAGKLGICVSGDTISFVTKNPALNLIKYTYSHNGGASWQTTDIVAPMSNNVFAPTLFKSTGETIVSYKNGYDSQVAISNNEIHFPTILPMNADTFDTSPYVERLNGQLKRFSLDIPYPESILDSNNQIVNPFVDPMDADEYLSPLYFTDIDLSPSNQNVYFFGPDVMTGIVRSNSDIYIKNAGGGNNNGWPTFYAPVITGGVIVSSPAAYPLASVFRGGLIENAPVIDYIDEIPTSSNTQVIGPDTYSPDNIVMINVTGNTYTAMLGQIQTERRVIADAWSDYPIGYPNTTPSYRNYFAVRDTVWNIIPGGTCSGNIIKVNSKLWIKGQFSGHHTWCVADSIFIIGDITLTNTTPGTDPYPSNTLDSVTLVSEKSILLKYGYKDPVDSLRYHPLCRADNDPIYIYASLYALGDGMGDSHKDGVFTFEYQHPHGSIEATWIDVPGPGGESTLFDWIDLHRNRWPQTQSYPWPASLDFPWYNPLWPERAPYLERGTIQLWGTMAQRRRGYVHRNYYDSNWPSNGVWNPSIDFCGNTSSPTANNIQLYQNPSVSVTLQTRDFPGASGGGVGYKKNYNWDRRNRLSTGWDENSSTSFLGLGLNLSNYNNNLMQRYYRKSYLRVPHDKSFARSGERAYYSINDQLIYADIDVVTDISASTSGDGIIRGIALCPDTSPLIYQLTETGSTYNMHVKAIDASSGEVNYETSIEVPTMINDVCVMSNGRRLVAQFDEQGDICLWEINTDNYLNLVENWQIEAAILPEASRLKNCRLYMLPSGNSRVEVFFYIPADATSPESTTALYHASASFPVSNEDYMVPAAPAIKFTTYPNPMRGELKLQVENAKAKNLSIDVYNIRGQLVRSIPLPKQSDSNITEFIWNGTDGNNAKVANGIYLLRLMVNDKAVVTKRICRY